MPGSTLPNMSIVTPALGGDSGDWDDLLNDALGVIDEHDHTAGAGKRITTAALDIDADLTIAGFALTNAGQVAFTAVSALASGSKTLFVSSSDNELYWRTNAGTNVKLTSGTSINTSLVGGIVGDYTSVGAEVAYDDANDRYTFKQEGSPKPWARIASADVRIYEYNTTETVYVGLKAPSGLASSYDITWPTAAPGSTAIVQMDSSGNLSVSNTVPNAVTFSTSITTPTIAGTPNFTGAVTMASTLGVTGLITATAGVTAAADQHITVSGTGEYKHGERSVHQSPHLGVQASGGTFSFDTSGAAPKSTAGSGVVSLHNLIGCKAGDRLTAVTASGNDVASVAPTFALYIMRNKNVGSGSVAITPSRDGSALSPFTYTLTLDTPVTLAAGDVVWLEITSGAGSTDWFTLGQTFDRP